MLLIVISCCGRIFFTHYQYTARLDWERKFIAKNAGKKVVMATAKAPIDTLIMAWGTPYEFWLLSTIEQGKTESMIVADSAQQFSWASGFHNKLITTWGCVPYDSLPKKYFHFNDTVSGYAIEK
jgi:hypothetical protein